MHKRIMFLLIALTVSISGVLAKASPPTQSSTGDSFGTSTVGPSGGEPSIATALDGTLYISYPGGAGMAFYASHNDGKTWKAGGIADPGSGDTTVNTDSSGAIYQGNLNDNTEGDVWKSIDGGKHWTKGVVANPSVFTTVDGDSATDSPFLMDREWTDAYIPAGKTTDDARVYIGYHDFVPSFIWVNTSKDGGKTFGSQVNVITDPVALANSFCNTIPGGLKVVQSGPHAGRVYVAWLAGSVATNAATGCNETQLDTFGQIWMAWSDDEGATWTDKLVYDAGFGRDASAIFADLALDKAGNPYVAWTLNGAPPHTGASGDQWDIYVSASFDNAASFIAPVKVTSDVGTHFFPAIAAGDPGRVVVAYISTPSVIPQLPYGKPFPGEDPNAKWYVYLSRSLNLNAASPTWVQEKLTPNAIHTGDVCTLGIFCLPGQLIGIQNRDLLDFIDVVTDPAGMVHVAYGNTEAKPGKTVVQATSQLTGVPLLKKIIQKVHIPKVRKPVKTRVLGEKLAGTGVGEAPFAGLILLLLAAALMRAFRRRA